jgi:hypothetical protein
VRASGFCRSQGLQERLTEAELALDSSSRLAKEMEEAYQLATKEVTEVKQRARALLEEKDAQLQAARVSPSFCFTYPSQNPNHAFRPEFAPWRKQGLAGRPRQSRCEPEVHHSDCTNTRNEKTGHRSGRA